MRWAKRLPLRVRLTLAGQAPRRRRLAADIGRPLLLFAATCATLVLCFALVRPGEEVGLPIPATGLDPQLITEAGKELSGIVTTLTTLVTGMFVLVAVVARHHTQPGARCPVGRFVLLVVFVLAAGASFFRGMHARYEVAAAMLSKTMDTTAIGGLIGAQAWLTALAGAAAVALVGDALLTVRARAGGGDED